MGDNLRFLKESFGELASLLTQLVKVGGAPAGKLLGDADFDYLKEEIPRALTQSLEGVDRVAKIVRAMKEFSHPAREKPRQPDQTLNESPQGALSGDGEGVVRP